MTLSSLYKGEIKMIRGCKKIIVLTLITGGMALAIGNSGAMAQDASQPPASTDQAPTSEHHHHHHHGRHGHHRMHFLVGVCVGQALAGQTPAIALTPGQKPDEATWKKVKDAKKTCFKTIKAAFKAAHKDSCKGGSKDGGGSGGKED
jgi:hypothetical protein